MRAGRWSFGPFQFDAGRYRLTRDGQDLAVQPKPLDLLVCLLRAPGQLVTLETLQEVLYPDVTVTRNALRNVVLKLREALGPEHEAWVETVSRKGVRFVGPVVVGGEGASEPGAQARMHVHLPAERDRFVGRTADQQALAAALGAARLVTVLGPGGVGKTRLALHHAWADLPLWSGGVWFCDLTAATSSDAVARAVATAMDLPLGEGDPLVRIGHALAARGRSLLVLDNFEQLVSCAQATVGGWLERAPEAHFLVTSRDRLRLTGEHLLDLGPLSQDEGEALFVDRAQAVDRRFVAPSTGELGALVGMLDALPLAIELAAGRVRVLSVAEITLRMTDRFALLASEGGRPPRHATLRAVLDDSWELLSPDEQQALAWVSTFEGGFSLDAAEAVLATDGGWPVSLVQRLVDQSLVRVVPGHPGTSKRFDLLASVRAYAAERLETLASTDRAAERHGAWFARLATEAFGRPEAGERLAPDLSNLVVACRRAVARGDLPCAVATLCGVWSVVELQGHFALAHELARHVRSDDGWASWVLGRSASALGRFDEAEAVLGAALARAETGADRALVVQLHRGLAGLLMSTGRAREARGSVDAALREIGPTARHEPALVGLLLLLADLDRITGHADPARAGYTAALDAARRVGDRRVEWLALIGLGSVLHYHLGDLRGARAAYEASLLMVRARSAAADEGRLLGHLGALCDAEGRPAEAVACLEAALAIHRRLGCRQLEGLDLGRLGQAYADQGRADLARPLLERALSIQRELGARREEGVVLGNLGELWRTLGHARRAEACLEEALAIHREHRNRRFEGLVSGSLAEVYRADGHLERARATLEAALAIHRETGNTVEQAYTLGQMAVLGVQGGDLGSASRFAAEGVRLLREIDDRRDLPGLLCTCAEVAVAAGEPRAARVAIAEAEALSSGRSDPELLARLARVRTSASRGAARPPGQDVGQA
jgi:predicted ATPase/DNA-binding winged helix-turn-helix (wHTH) protein